MQLPQLTLELKENVLYFLNEWVKYYMSEWMNKWVNACINDENPSSQGAQVSAGEAGWLPTKMSFKEAIIIFVILPWCQVWPSALQTQLKASLSAHKWGHISDSFSLAQLIEIRMPTY